MFTQSATCARDTARGPSVIKKVLVSASMTVIAAVGLAAPASANSAQDFFAGVPPMPGAIANAHAAGLVTVDNRALLRPGLPQPPAPPAPPAPPPAFAPPPPPPVQAPAPDYSGLEQCTCWAAPTWSCWYPA